MSERQATTNEAPPCPMCMSETDVKQVHRERTRELIIYKCRSCSVEYPVINDR